MGTKLTSSKAKSGKGKKKLSEQELEKCLSFIYTTPSNSAASAIKNLLPKTSQTETGDLLRSQIQLLLDGELSRAEAMLISQATYSRHYSLRKLPAR